ncbi:hypothetical protein CERSUDRAFT_99212 [Gelatoporia subvermispora B]|uniref:Uncharacterized protein n=1 Tax=Ceriporiopsis subvermispora (strain B) TaxID=914234 RepID=M2PBB0_CERS8|nr:hypothetical protein CERSUDRAFT_99212 [Gelatoporia subvermispora B]
MSRYLVQSSDVLSDMRINVLEENGGKERFLADDEIIEHVVENATSTITWSIHRPKRGWYIRLRAASFPPGVFIVLTPVPQSSPYHAEAALTFPCRTNAPPSVSRSLTDSPRASLTTKGSLDSDATLTDGQRDSVVHSYPPTPPAQTPPAVVVHPPSPRSVHAKLDELELADSDTAPSASSASAPSSSSSRSRPRPARVALTHFLLTPHAHAHVPEQRARMSVLTRVLATLKNHTPSYSYSFTLSPLPAVPPGSPGPADTQQEVPTPTPLLTFHDRTPVWAVGSTTGVIEVDALRTRALGVETSFYVAVALTYLEFLGDRESYLAAIAD